jgi:hypothetical protein
VTTNDSFSTLALRSSRSPWSWSCPAKEGVYVSIVRVGLAETKNFAEGYDAIFGKKKPDEAKKMKTTTKKKKKTSKKK